MKLIQEHNGILTKYENQKQYLLQVVNDYKISYPKGTKDTLINKYLMVYFFIF